MPFTKGNADTISKACSDLNLKKAAKFHIKPLNGLDILVCGRCLKVFHLLPEMKKHKQKGNCVQPEKDPSKFNPTPNIWAFMLWKNSPECKKMKIRNAGENSVMWKKWQEIPSEQRNAWVIAGNILFDMNWIHKSEEDENTADKFTEMFTQQTFDMVQSDSDENQELLKNRFPMERIVLSKTLTKNIKLPKDTQWDETRAPKNIINKKIDKKTKSLKYLVHWEGDFESQSTWEPEERLSKHRNLIDLFEERLASPSRPCRSSKAKALHKVKEWILKKGAQNEDDDDDLQKSDVEEEEEVDEFSDAEFEPEDQGSSGGEKTTSTSSEELEDEEALLAEKLAKTGKKRKAGRKGNAKRQKRDVQQEITDDRILHVSNCHRSIRVNANALPKVKPGIFHIEDSPSLLLLSPMLCKDKPKEEQPGLVVITNNILRNRPGIRKRQGLKLFEDSPSKIFNQELPEPISMLEQKPKSKPTTNIIRILSSKSDPISPAKKVVVPAKVNNKPTQNKIYSTLLPAVESTKIKSTNPASVQKTILTESSTNLEEIVTIPATLKSTVPLGLATASTPRTPNIVRPPRVIKAPQYPGKSKSVKPTIISPMKIAPVPLTAPVDVTQPTISIQASGDVTTGPQHVEIPQGVDPGALEVPAGMQLMVSDNGEYYLLPQQPEGSTVALAHDPESGAVQVVAIPEQPVTDLASVNITANQTTTAIITQQETVEVPINPSEQGKFVLVMTKEGELMLIQTDQNSAVESETKLL